MEFRVTTDGSREGERGEPSDRASGDGGTASRAGRSEPGERDPRKGERRAKSSGERSEPRDERPASSDGDARRVVVDRDDPTARWRWRCPNRHCDWEPTNSHVWCATCASLHGVDPEYWELLDTKTGERVPWGSIEFR